MAVPTSHLPDLVSRLRAAGCVFAEDEALLLRSAARTSGELVAMVDRRVAGVPLEHVIGWAEFCGLRIAVDPGVFVPRRRTEFLVEQAAAMTRPGAVVVDLCCGSGALGAAIAARTKVELYAADVDPAAVECARRNLAVVGGRVYEGDLFEPMPDSLRGRIDILLANVPYVPTEEVGLMPPEARLHEARVALDGGADGFGVLRRVTAEAANWLAPGGQVLVETSVRQVPAALELFAADGLPARVVHSEDLFATAIVAGRPGDGSTRRTDPPHRPAAPAGRPERPIASLSRWDDQAR